MKLFTIASMSSSKKLQGDGGVPLCLGFQALVKALMPVRDNRPGLELRSP
jgi:hypothetical protein